MISDLLHQNGAVIPHGDLDLIPAGKREITQQTFGYVNDALTSGSNMKTPGASFFHSCEMSRKIIRDANFIRNHKINIDSSSYTFIRKVMKWRRK